jgi:hypothetical protein
MTTPLIRQHRHRALVGFAVLGMAGVAAAPLAAQSSSDQVCTPPPASVVIGQKNFPLLRSGTCYMRDATTGGGIIMHGDIPPQRMTSPPLFVVRRGTTVSFKFAEAPQGVVRLKVRRGPGLKSHADFRLSPFATTWRARGLGGVMTLSVPFAPVTTPWGHSIDNDGFYVARFVVR